MGALRRLKKTDPDIQEQMMKILVGYDGSDVSRVAFQLAKTHAQAFGAEVYLLRCMEASPNRHLKEVEEAEQEMEKVRQILTADKISVETHVHLLISGLTPGEDLVRFAKKIAADEIILGVRKKSRLNKFVFGSTVQYVILNAHCPVATVK